MESKRTKSGGQPSSAKGKMLSKRSISSEDSSIDEGKMEPRRAMFGSKPLTAVVESDTGRTGEPSGEMIGMASTANPSFKRILDEGDSHSRGESSGVRKAKWDESWNPETTELEGKLVRQIRVRSSQQQAGVPASDPPVAGGSQLTKKREKKRKRKESDSDSEVREGRYQGLKYPPHGMPSPRSREEFAPYYEDNDGDVDESAEIDYKNL